MTYESDRARIAREIRERIRSGQYEPGHRIPSGAALAAEYGVSERTASLAVGDLRDEGLVHGRKGRGVFVGPGRAEEGPVDRVAELEEQVAQLRVESAETRADLLALYDRLGQPRPGTGTTRARRTKSTG